MSIPQNALPEGGVPATGLFTPVQNIVTNTYDTPTGNTDAPYNETLIGDSAENLVGSSTKPYIQMALPTYIPTIYSNIYHMQSNLKDLIPVDNISSNREYPTSWAVKQYVASQLFGSETLTPEPVIDLEVSTGLTTTACVANTVDGSPNVTQVNQSTFITHFDIKQVDSARSGATKNIICISELGQQTIGDDLVFLEMKIELTGNKVFVANGKLYKTYEFISIGDSLTMIQFLNTNNDSIFFVTNYGGVFSSEVV